MEPSGYQLLVFLRGPKKLNFWLLAQVGRDDDYHDHEADHDHADHLDNDDDDDKVSMESWASCLRTGGRIRMNFKN